MANVIVDSGRALSGVGPYAIALFFSTVFLFSDMLILTASADEVEQYDRDSALQISQSAIGNSLGDYTFKSTTGQNVSLYAYRGKPLLISMIFTSCHHICPTTTKHIDKAARAAREVLGDASFAIVSIGFDTANDTPDAMRAFARQQNVSADNWHFLSATQETISGLSRDLGFQFYPSPRGFDHLIQLSMIGREGNVYNQVYGIEFGLPSLVEPLKRLVFDRPDSSGHLFSGLADRVRLFCTVYNPATGRYEIDNSLFIQIAIGFAFVISVAIYLIRESRRARRH